MSVKASAESLKRIPIFRECDTVPLQVLAFSAPAAHFQTGDYIIDRTQRADAAFFMLSGVADVMGQKGFIGRAEPGSLLGEVALISRTHYTVTAIAREPVTAACIDYDLFLKVAREYPEFATAVLHALSNRLELSMRDFDSVRVMLNKVRSFPDRG
jgi:CRP-like cAMP-binding protein